jgi:hypothetical protein
MESRIRFAVGILVSLACAAHAEPQLLKSFYFGGEPNQWWAGETLIPPPLLTEIVVSTGGVGVGSGIVWHDGDTGQYDFTSDNCPGFDWFVRTITQNPFDSLVGFGFGSPIDHSSYCGFLFSRSYLGLYPDLLGKQIDLIRLIVEDFHSEFDFHDGPGCVEFHVTARYELWSVPEPATLLIALPAGLLFLRARRQR